MLKTKCMPPYRKNICDAFEQGARITSLCLSLSLNFVPIGEAFYSDSFGLHSLTLTFVI